MLSKLRDLFGKITHSSVVDEKLVKEINQDIQRILIQSDVNVALVKRISKEIEERALKEKLPAGLSRKEHLMKIIYSRLVEFLGGEKYTPRMDAHKILLVGLYGSGKTSAVGKLSKFYSKRGLKPCAIVTDTWRPAAFQQAKQLGDSLKVPVFGDEKEKNAVTLLKKGLEQAKKYDVVIVDSAGRDSLNRDLLDEITKIKENLKPNETFLVISADIGQTATKQAEEFNKAVGLTGVIVTKTDASGKAGGALSACAVAKIPVAFITTGEKVEDLEVFDSQKFVSRLLGFPDLGELLKKAKEAAEETEFNPEDLFANYNLKSFYKQMEATKKMGPLKKVFEMMGLTAAIPQDMVEASEQRMKSYKFIIDSMTEAEKLEPDTINASRVKRIAKGSGRLEAEIKELLKQFNMSKKMLGKLKKGKRLGGPLGAMMKNFKMGTGG